MNTLKVTLISVKELKDEKGRGLEDGKHDIWCRTTLDSSGQSVETDVVSKCDTCWSGTTFNKKMSLCVDAYHLYCSPNLFMTATHAHATVWA